MSHLSITTAGPSTTVRAESDGRLLGYIHQGPCYASVTVIPQTGDAVHYVVDTFPEAVERFRRLTLSPVGDQVECGDIHAEQALVTVDVPADSDQVQVQIAQAGHPERLDVALVLLLDAAEAVELVDALSFALARIAVQS